MIQIVNKRQGGHGEYIGRPSVLGNPFSVHEYGRKDCIELYREWLRDQWQDHGPARQALMQLAQRYKAEKKLTLVCWCAPERCHGEIVKEAICGIIKKGLV